jgi:hypothetical protein
LRLKNLLSYFYRNFKKQYFIIKKTKSPGSNLRLILAKKNIQLMISKSETNKKSLELRGIDPLTFRMQSGRSTTELQPLGIII